MDTTGHSPNAVDIKKEPGEVFSTSLPSESEPIAGAAITARAPFKPGWRFYATFGALSVITLAVALDANTISVALPV